jgi:hypothetical protein
MHGDADRDLFQQDRLAESRKLMPHRWTVRALDRGARGMIPLVAAPTISIVGSQPAPVEGLKHAELYRG